MVNIRSVTPLFKTHQLHCNKIQTPPDNPHLHGLSLLLCFSLPLLLSPSCLPILGPSHSCPLLSPSTLQPAPGPLHLLSFLPLWLDDHWLKTHQHHHSLRDFLSWSHCLSFPLFFFIPYAFLFSSLVNFSSSLHLEAAYEVVTTNCVSCCK